MKKNVIIIILFILLLTNIVFSTTRISIMNLCGQQISAADAASITELLRSDIVNTNKYIVVDRASIDRILLEQNFQQTGCTNQECAVKIGKLLNVKKMVEPINTKVADTSPQTFIIQGIKIGTNVSIPLSDVYKDIYSNSLGIGLGFEFKHVNTNIVITPNIHYFRDNGTPVLHNSSVYEHINSSLEIYNLNLDFGYDIVIGKIILSPVLGIGAMDIGEEIKIDKTFDNTENLYSYINNHVWAANINTGLAVQYKLTEHLTIFWDNKIKYFIIDKYTANISNLLYTTYFGIKFI